MLKVWGVHSHFWGEDFHREKGEKAKGMVKIRLVTNETDFVDRTIRGMTVWEEGFDTLCPMRAVILAQWWTADNVGPLLEMLLQDEDPYVPVKYIMSGFKEKKKCRFAWGLQCPCLVCGCGCRECWKDALEGGVDRLQYFNDM